ncbi:MAG: hypothetical protein LBR45_03495 [Bacteroidales bacterium]|jgi:uncharacterized protein (DUF1786 family)|nr:hypothetical protein [Bacteroidales bacterium]
MRNNIDKTFTKVGRITMPIAKAARMKAADIYVDENHIKHVVSRHSRELKQLGLSAIDIIRLVAGSFNRIYKADRGCYFIVIYNKEKEKTKSSVIELNYSAKKEFYEIKNSVPYRTEFFNNKSLLWKKERTL